MKTDFGLSAYCHGMQMYGSDAGQPPRSLYTKGLSPLCDNSYDCITIASRCSNIHVDALNRSLDLAGACASKSIIL